MSNRDDHQLSLTSDPETLAQARDAVRTWLASCGFSELRAADVVLAADEALSNVIRHGYENVRGQRIEVHLRRIRDPQRGGGVEIEIRDWGRQVPLDKIRGRDLDELRPGGLGVHIIRNLMDEALYSHAEGGGMRLIIRKFLPPQEKS